MIEEIRLEWQELMNKTPLMVKRLVPQIYALEKMEEVIQSKPEKKFISSIIRLARHYMCQLISVTEFMSWESNLKFLANKETLLRRSHIYRLAALCFMIGPEDALLSLQLEVSSLLQINEGEEANVLAYKRIMEEIASMNEDYRRECDKDMKKSEKIRTLLMERLGNRVPISYYS